jgi:hypothetical protein
LNNTDVLFGAREVTVSFDCTRSEWITVDYADGIRDSCIRHAKLVPWTDDDLTEQVDYRQEEPDEQYFNVGDGPVLFVLRYRSSSI